MLDSAQLCITEAAILYGREQVGKVHNFSLALMPSEIPATTCASSLLPGFQSLDRALLMSQMETVNTAEI